MLSGQTQAFVAEGLGVHPATVAKWTAKHRVEGEAGSAAKPTPGRPRFLTPVQEARVKNWLAQKPTAHGFRTGLWSARMLTDAPALGIAATATAVGHRELQGMDGPTAMGVGLRGGVEGTHFFPPWSLGILAVLGFRGVLK